MVLYFLARWADIYMWPGTDLSIDLRGYNENKKVMIHEDDRRTLEDFPEGKLIRAKQFGVLGNHYHKIKTEYFTLISGNIMMARDGNVTEMQRGEIYEVHPGVKHMFVMSDDAVMIGLCSHPYDASDDYK
jgi:mannose-6-phosphate isomerase-like protein (cupin superfamily)